MDTHFRKSIFAPKTSIVHKLSSVSRRNENRICINVGGTKFETYKTTLKAIPDTRLSWLSENRSLNPDFDPSTGEYFFDRHPGMFQMILNYYRTGKLHVPMDVCGPVFEEELAYWGLDETQIEPCCWNSYRSHRDAQDTLREFSNSEEENDSDDEEELAMRARFGISDDFIEKEKSFWDKWRPKIWSFLDNPKADRASKIYAIISIAFIITSIAVFCLETHIELRYQINPNISLTGLKVSETQRLTRPILFIDVIEYVCNAFFTLEVFARLLTCPTLKIFAKEPLNWLDIISIIPFYATRILEAMNLEHTVAYLCVSAFRLIRIFRIMRLTRHFSGLKILGHTIRASAKELLLLFLVLIIGILIFAVVIFFAEQVDENSKNDFQNIPMGFWWAVVTMTTLGYGDMIPRTGLGYVVGTMCAVCGLLMLSLPVPIIVSNFTLYYSHAQAKMKLPKKSKKILVGADHVLKSSISNQSLAEEDETHQTGSGSNQQLERKTSGDSALGSDNNTSPQDSQNGTTGISVIFTDDFTDNQTESSVTSSPILCDDIRHHVDVDNNNIKHTRDRFSVEDRNENSLKRHRLSQKRGSHCVPPATTSKKKSLPSIEV